MSDQTIPRKGYEIIVSDSSSTDNTVEIAESLADKVVICKKHSAGFGRNFGARNAKTNLIGFIDADTIACHEWIEAAINSLKKNISVTGSVESLEKDSITLSLFYSWWSIQSHLSVLINYPVFPGFNIAVQKKAFEKINGFSERDFTCEDLDFSLRLSKIGKIGFSEKMRVKTSNRRLKEKGIVKYIFNAWNFLLFNRSNTWQMHRQQ